MIALALLMLAQAPSTGEARMRILVLDVRSESISAETSRAIRDEITVELARDPVLSVLSTEDLRAAMTIEAEKSVAGCESSSCLAEIGAAMGARFVVHGSIANVGGTRVVYLNLFDTEKNEAIAREVADAPSEAQLLGAVRSSVAKVRERISAMHTAKTAVPEPPSKPMDPLFLGGAIGAGAGAITALVGGVIAVGAIGTINDLNEDPDVRVNAQEYGLAASILGGVGLAIAGAGVGVAVWRALE